MAVSHKIEYASLDDLSLDPKNPRLGKRNTDRDLTQDEVLELIRGWELEELATSFLGSGFWPQEALLVHREDVGGHQGLVVVEGNRRLAALKLLKRTYDGNPLSKTWTKLIEGIPQPAHLFTEIPYLLIESRRDVEAFLGFRHVTGIKEWHPEEKAEYIARLIEDHGYSYEAIKRLIGSKTATVRQNYIAYNVARQLQDADQDVPDDRIAGRFSVLYLSLRAPGVQSFLGLDSRAEPAQARTPVPADRIENLKLFGTWLLGSDEVPPFLVDSRQVDRFGEILANADALKYIKETETPDFDVAAKIAGGEVQELISLVNGAATYVERVLSRAYRYSDSEDLRDAVGQLSKAVQTLIKQVTPEAEPGELPPQ